jgi:hypothetical protein
MAKFDINSPLHKEINIDGNYYPYFSSKKLKDLILLNKQMLKDIEGDGSIKHNLPNLSNNALQALKQNITTLTNLYTAVADTN